MKKLLALVLALVMTLSLCVTSNAAFDGEEYDYDEAVEVMAAVGVFEGDENGKFNGSAELTREQAAKLVAYLDLGKKVAEALPAVKVFNDVEASRWSAKYVAYCADAGYIAGVGDGNFDPAGKLTGYAFGKMVLCALGYKADMEGFTGANWTIKVAALMENNKIAKGIDDSASAALTREQAAQYCLNALKATTVEYKNKQTISIGDVEIKQASEASKVETTAAYKAKIGDTEEATQYLELGEKLYKGDLVFTSDDTDAFGRPSHSWTYKTDDVGNYADTAVATFTASTKAAAVATALKGYKTTNGKKVNDVDKYAAITFNTNGSAVYASAGATETIAKGIADETANGKLIEVFANDDNEITDFVAVNYTNEEVTKVTTDKKTGDVTYRLTTYGDFVDYADKDKTDTIKFDVAPEKDDIVTVVKIGSKAYVYATEKVTGPVTYAKADTKLTIAGTTYESNYDYYTNDNTNFALTDKDATVYVDQFGFVADYEGPTTSGDKTVAVTKAYQTLVDGELVYMFKGITSDGEIMDAEYESGSPVAGQVYKYADADSDDAYELTQVTSAANYAAATGNDSVVYVTLGTSLTTSSKKIDLGTNNYGYFTKDVKVIAVDADGKYTVSEGVQKVAAGTTVVAVLKVVDDDATCYVDALYVLGSTGAESTSSEDVIFVVGSSTPASVAKTVDGKQKTYYEYTAYEADGDKISGFYAVESSATTGFYTKDIQTASGAYELTGNTYAEATGEFAVVVSEVTFAKVNAQGVMTVSGTDYDLSDADFVNTVTNGEVDSIDDVNDAIDASKTVKGWIMWNQKTGVVDYVFITAE